MLKTVERETRTAFEGSTDMIRENLVRVATITVAVVVVVVVAAVIDYLGELEVMMVGMMM